MGKILLHRLAISSSWIALSFFGALASCGNDSSPPRGSGGDTTAASGGGAGAPIATGGAEMGGQPEAFGGDSGTQAGPRCDSFLPPRAEDPVESETCGCLGVDDRWACSLDTCPESDGAVRTLRPESGFLQIPRRQFVSEGVEEESPTHRIFYSFHPADDAPEAKPLLVFFNGGPGSATMPFLFAQNTAPQTLIVDGSDEHGVEANAASYTRSFNLLYIDAPYTGFSYSPGSAAPLLHRPDREAGIFIEVILGFLKRHPTLERTQVGLVGESYGGTRAILMSERLLYYPELIDPDVRTNVDPNSSSVYFDPELYKIIQAHFARTRPELGGAELTPSQVAEQFGWQILLQPGLPNRTQTDPHSLCEGTHCAAMNAGPCTDEDTHDCTESTSFWERYDQVVFPKLEDPDALSLALGVDAKSIEWLRWCRPSEGKSPDTISLTPQVSLATGEPFHLRGRMLYSLVRSVQFVKTLMTNAQFDLAIRSPELWAVLHDALPGTPGVRILADEPQGAARPGRVEFEYPAGELRSVRFPSYPAGHMVPYKAAAELYDDIVAFWGGN